MCMVWLLFAMDLLRLQGCVCLYVLVYVSADRPMLIYVYMLIYLYAAMVVWYGVLVSMVVLCLCVYACVWCRTCVSCVMYSWSIVLVFLSGSAVCPMLVAS